MKKIKILTILFLSVIGLFSCTDDNASLTYIAKPAGNFAFSNAFLSEYVLEPTSSGNVGERFFWNTPDFGVQTNITYELQKSITGDASDVEVIGSTINNDISISIGKLLKYAKEAGLDNDPSTPAPDTGTVSFRVRAYVGDAASTTEQFTDFVALTVVLPENVPTGTGFSVTTWGVVGSGYNNWGAFLDSPFYTTSDPDVLVAYVTLVDGEIKFRDDNAWALNYGDTGADGVLDAGGDNIAVTAGTYKITFNTSTLAYSIDPFSWGIVGSGYNDWGATPDGKFYYDYTTDTFKVGIKLKDGEIKFRLNNDWGTNFGDTGADGTLEAGGDNIAVTAGFYTASLDLNANTYTLEAADVWGVVGSGYNDWGATPDYNLTEVNPGIWVGDIVPLLDGEIKFRLNEDWGFNFGDTGADGTLDDGGDNIAVTAGNYRIVLDLNENTYLLNKVN